MISQEFLASDLFNWVILPMLIFTARLIDVPLGTMRHISLARGFRNIVPILGFFEVLIWVFAMSQIMKNLNNVLCYLAWAGGFSAGTYLGMYLENKIAMGMQVLRIITHQDSSALIKSLTAENVGVTTMDGQGAKGPVKIIFTILKRKNLDKVVRMINKHNPSAFYTIEDVRVASQGVFPSINPPDSRFYQFRRLFPVRKGK
ncbi:MAG: DUF2179 domain-containing protein [Bacteroidia bacterium]